MPNLGAIFGGTIMEHKCVNEERLRKLEQQEAIMGVKIDNLIKELDSLTTTLKVFIWTMIPASMTAIGFLITYWVKIEK